MTEEFWITEQNDFSNPESLRRSDASHQVSAQSDLWFESIYRLKNFKMAAIAAIFDIRTERYFSNSESLCVSDASNQISAIRHSLGGDVV